MHFVTAKGILSARNSMNIYRGCTHGCIYCDSRSSCYQMQHDFTDVAVKQNAPVLLEEALRRKRKKCMISTGSMCDPYLPCEKELGLTRQCLQLIDQYGFGLALLTKSTLVLRDLDLLQSINKKAKAVVQMTLTTYDEDLCQIIEPNVASSRERFAALKTCQSHGIPTIVWLCPLLPLINDTEENLRGILQYCFTARVKGIICFGIGLTLRQGDREYYYQKLDEHFPGLRQLYQRKYGLAYEIRSEQNQVLMDLFHQECQAHGVMHNTREIFSYLNEFPQTDPRQLSLFD